MCPDERLTRACKKCGTTYSFSKEDVFEGEAKQNIRTNSEDINALLWVFKVKKSVSARFIKCPACGEEEVLSTN